MTRPRTPAWVCSRIGLALLAMMLVWYAAANGIALAAGALAPALLENPWFLWAVNDVPLYLFGLPAFLLVLARLPEQPAAPRTRPPLGAGRFALILVFCLGAGYLLNLLAGLVLEALMRLFPGGSGMDALELLLAAGGWLPGLLFGALVPAVGEEFIFRYLLRRKLRGSGDKIYIFFSAFCFSLFHANFVQIPYTFVIGVALAWLYTLRGRLWLPMLAHFIINLLGIVVMPLALEHLPWLANLYGLVCLLVLIPAAVALFFVYQRRARVAMQPPTEPGWPYRQTRPLWTAHWRGPAWPADPAAPAVLPQPPGLARQGGAGWNYGGGPAQGYGAGRPHTSGPQAYGVGQPYAGGPWAYGAGQAGGPPYTGGPWAQGPAWGYGPQAACGLPGAYGGRHGGGAVARRGPSRPGLSRWAGRPGLPWAGLPARDWPGLPWPFLCRHGLPRLLHGGAGQVRRRPVPGQHWHGAVHRGGGGHDAGRPGEHAAAVSGG